MNKYRTSFQAALPRWAMALLLLLCAGKLAAGGGFLIVHVDGEPNILRDFHPRQVAVGQNPFSQTPHWDSRDLNLERAITLNDVPVRADGDAGGPPTHCPRCHAHVPASEWVLLANLDFVLRDHRCGEASAVQAPDELLDVLVPITPGEVAFAYVEPVQSTGNLSIDLNPYLPEQEAVAPVVELDTEPSLPLQLQELDEEEAPQPDKRPMPHDVAPPTEVEEADDLQRSDAGAQASEEDVEAAQGTDAQLTCWPNPTPGALKVQLREAAEPCRFRVLAMNGQVLAEAGSEAAGKAAFDLGHLPNGVYLVQALQGGKSWTQQVVVQH